MERNELCELPDSFGCLRRLRTLHLERNPLERLPGSCAELRLSELFVDGEKLVEWPSQAWRDLYYEMQIMGGT